MINAPEGSLGLANSPASSWMSSEFFLKILEHIKNYNQVSYLVLLDNHESHCTLDAVLYCREWNSPLRISTSLYSSATTTERCQ